jgi:DNA-binding MarR family transcriptional regulator
MTRSNNQFSEEYQMKRHLTIDEHRLWVIFHQTHDLLVKYEDKVLEEANLTKEQHLILWLIDFINEGNDDPVILSDLASSLFKNLNSVSALVNRMATSGLLEKHRDLPDQRAVRLVITPKGKEALAKAVKPNSLMIRNVFSAFSPEEMHTFRVLLKKLRAEIVEEGDFDEIRMDPEMSDRKRIEKFLKKRTF